MAERIAGWLLGTSRTGTSAAAPIPAAPTIPVATPVATGRRRARRGAPTPPPTPEVPDHAAEMWLPVTSAQAASLPHSIPQIVRGARTLLDQQPHRGGLVLDLSAVPPLPCCAELVFLTGLLRRVLGPRSSLTVAGLTPALAAPLISGGLPPGVTVIDTRGRRWPGPPPPGR